MTRIFERIFTKSRLLLLDICRNVFTQNIRLHCNPKFEPYGKFCPFYALKTPYKYHAQISHLTNALRSRIFSLGWKALWFPNVDFYCRGQFDIKKRTNLIAVRRYINLTHRRTRITKGGRKLAKAIYETKGGR